MELHDKNLNICAELPNNIYQIYWAVENEGEQNISETSFTIFLNKLEQAGKLSVDLMQPIFDSVSVC